MEMIEVVGGVHHVSVVRVSWQLVVEGASVTLIDSGWSRDYDSVVASLEAIGRTPASVEALILTHAHVDHMGCAAEMKRRHSTRVMSHADEEGLALGQYHQAITIPQLLVRMYRPSVVLFAIDALRRGGTSVEPLDSIVTFDDDQVLDIPGRPRALHTPGHTSGSTSYIFADRGVLVTGDALATSNIYTEKVGCQVMPAEFNHDHAQAIRSLEVIAAQEADVVLSGHGQPFFGSPARAVDEALALY